MNLLQQFKPIRLMVMDVDGVLTDGSILLLDNGQMARSMHTKDGYAMKLAVTCGYEICIISGAHDEAVNMRLKKLGIHSIHLGIQDKATLLKDIMTSGGYAREEVLFIGDDMPDFEAMQLVGLSCCPLDAVEDIKAISTYVSHHNGGKGCVRDVIEKVLKLNGHWPTNTAIPSV
jgi:3-deoxy-D-manno-octulosonate 8-phosphate phosphatase (KDO 8-P phosphatase)